MGLRSWVAPCACVLVLACRSENADPAQTNAELGRVTQQLSEEHAEQVYCNNLLTDLSPPETSGSGDASAAPPPSTGAAAPPSDGTP